MGIRSRIKKLLPIIGSGSPSQPIRDIPQARPAARPSWDEPEDPPSARGDTPVEEYLRALVDEHPVVLFMKGTPSQPQCGFSANAAGILSGYGVPFHHFNVLSDPDVREGVKRFSDWPTIPQIYVNGEFVGGSDILRELHESGELRQMLSEVGGD